jgi:hypothetical protein
MKDFIKWWINELKKRTDEKLKKKDGTEKEEE